MASRSFHALFLRARDQFLGSSRWVDLAVLALAGLHLAILTPFVDGSLRYSEVSSEIERLEAVASDLRELQQALQAAGAEVQPAIGSALDGLDRNLATDLARLEATRRLIESAARDEAAEPAATGGASDPPEEATGREATAEPRMQPFVLEDPDWIADIRDASGRDELLAALSPIVEQLIVEPRYFDANRIWKESSLPSLERRLDAVAALVPHLRGRFPEGRADWESLVGALGRCGRAARELRFEPPGQPFWWTTETAGGALALGMSPQVESAVRTPDPGSLAGPLVEADASFGALEARVAAGRQSHGGRAGSPRFAGLELAAVAPMFPLLIGLLLAAVMIRRSRHLRELGIATGLAIEHGGPEALRRWLWSQVQWKSTVSSASEAWRRCVFQTLAVYFLAMGWIAVAAVQLRQLRTLDQQRLVIFTIAGASLVLLAVAHRLLVARRAITQPVVTQPVVTQAVAAQPDATQPVVTQPVVTRSDGPAASSGETGAPDPGLAPDREAAAAAPSADSPDPVDAGSPSPWSGLLTQTAEPTRAAAGDPDEATEPASDDDDPIDSQPLRR